MDLLSELLVKKKAVPEEFLTQPFFVHSTAQRARAATAIYIFSSPYSFFHQLDETIDGMIKIIQS